MVEKKIPSLWSIKKLVLYGTNGIINTAVTYTLFVIISNIINYQITIVIVYIIGIFLSYFLNGKLVFKIRGKLYLFILIYVGMLLLNLLITTILVEEFDVIKEIAQLFAIIIVFGVGYSLVNRYAFPNQASMNKWICKKRIYEVTNKRFYL